MRIPTFEIVPTFGIGQIQFGMSRHEVRSALGAPEFSHDCQDGFLSGFHVSYDPAGLVEFIELAKSDKFFTSFHDKSLNSLKADQTVAFVSEFDDADISAPEFGHSFIFPVLEMSLWHAVMPDSPDDPEGQYFDAIGIGRLGYFSDR
ncbi:hypothetical protein H8K32_05290 [Undibacterium jejuense]|uniref:Uncharacterized protein n=1 Tax=Undibacterium jejuense TaxID=1344949 RepID=A0A923KN52_9BURK|nr:hypothetical protein [Undibacterium jejuense]MBC3861508.1 hypothetical protein [Undibacterium jejuense]